MEANEATEQKQESRRDGAEMVDAAVSGEVKDELEDTKVEERLQSPKAQMELNSAESSEANLESNAEFLDSMLEEPSKLEESQPNKVESITSSSGQSNVEVTLVECVDHVQSEVSAQISSTISEDTSVQFDSDDKVHKEEVDDEMKIEEQELQNTSAEAESISMEVDRSLSDNEKDVKLSINDDQETSNILEADKTQSNSVTSTSLPNKSEPVTEAIISREEIKNPKEKDSTDKGLQDKGNVGNSGAEKETSQETTSVSKEAKESSASDQDKNGVTQTIGTEPEKAPEVDKESPSAQNSVQECNNVDQENSQDGASENPVFVHVNTENEKGDGDKNRTEADSQEIQDEEDFQNSQPQEDPIAPDDFVPVQMDEENDDTEQAVDEEQGASEELCIIPDTERVISQEEKEAAASMVPLRDPTDSNSTDNASKAVVTKELNDSANGKYMISTCTDENVNACMQCCLPRKSKYSVTSNKKTSFICDDNCLNAFKEKYGDKVVLNSEGDLRVKNLTSGTNNDNMVAKVKFHRKCMECEKKILNGECNLSWETMEFCNEFCLSKYQKRIGSNCANCQTEVRSNCLGKYCVRFGYDIRQFCSSVCLEEYKKGLKVCSYCQKDMSGGGDGFLAPVGDKGQFKDFCTQQCMEKYDIMSNNREQSIGKSGSTCSVCLNEKPITIEFEHDKKMNLFCGEPCFVAFKFVNNITPGKCDMCRNYFDNKILEEHSMYYDSAQHSFCSKSCQNIYIIAHRKIVPCSWCKVKKYNFDMIKRNSSSGPVLMMCSLNCLSLYQVSVNAVNSKKINCDHCRKSLQPLYHLTMSDATIRNFCSYSCVMAFQNQFPKAPITLNEPEESSMPVPTGAPKRTKKICAKSAESRVIPADVPTIPVISSVQSLATTNGPTPTNTRTTRAKNGTDASINRNANSTPPIVKTQIKQHIIIKPKALPPQRNVATMCKVVTANKGIAHKPTTATKEVQTDDLQDRTAIIPVPAPIYVPSPMWMYSMPFPVPFPFPLPVPVPIFIPTTRNSASGIMKEIKKIQVKIPTDPFEAELLMMAEMVAGDKKEENTDSESEEEDTTAPADEGTFSPEPVDASNTFGDDMLQMALKMATELDEPAVDLEGALTASTITASQGGENAVGNDESVDDPQPIHHMMERQAIRGRKRPGRPPRNTPSKRGRRSSNQMDMPMMAPPQPPPPPEPVEKPDANMCLKYTFGVNAWKQWVTTKNAELEKSSRRVKLFKPEILQLTADELNYSLCLFVKEVRKPNGQEYAPDTIYYLCLGIQQYLFENGRIDNIFCDAYYEKFTDCLDEVAKKFSVLYNDSHYIVTRVEEEHLWESKQLGAHSPHVLLSTLMFFNTKHFNLTTVDEHMQLSFSHIMKHWKRNPNQPGTNKVAGSRNVLLRFYPPQTASDSNTRKKKVYEQQENEDNPLRCPVKLYEFYLSKCPESVKTRNDVFYLLPERSCVPDSPVWYSTMPLPRNALEKMLHRVKMVKEINVALLTS